MTMTMTMTMESNSTGTREAVKRQTALVTALTEPGRYPHPAARVEKLETHISHILLAGDYAYKIKKPLNLGFLDFTSLKQRHYYCLQELRLNRRLAPDLYLDCIPICGTTENPVFGGDPGNVVEYALKMKRFPQAALLPCCLAEGRLQRAHMDILARQIAQFHEGVARVAPDQPYGMPEQVNEPALDNFRHCRELLRATDTAEVLARLEQWTQSSYAELRETLAERWANGFVRECHGDLHLANIILEEDQGDGRLTIFDCIEFSDALRWIDVMSDLAFLYMDLCRCGAPALARRLLNSYLEVSGDYGGLAVLPYYLVYRAMVRAKIAAIRLAQSDLAETDRGGIIEECESYLNLALELRRRPAPFLLITHGVSGSGKSYHTGHLLETLGAIRIRSDVERKRLFGLGALQASGSGLGGGIYSPENTQRTYGRLLRLSELILAAGYPVMVDATFLEADWRQRFRALARRRKTPFVVLHCEAEPRTLQRRVAQRHAAGDDAAEADAAVVRRQLARYRPLPAHEEALNAASVDKETLSQQILQRVRHSREHSAACTDDEPCRT